MPIISTPDDLHDLRRREEDLLSNHYSYECWLARTTKVYNKLLADHPSLEARPYQPEYAALYCMRNLSICAGALGIGKIFMSALAMCAIYEEWNFEWGGRPGQVQIIVPTYLSATSRWRVDLNKFSMLQGKVEVISKEAQVLTSTKPIWLIQQDFYCRRSKQARPSRPYISRLIYDRGLAPSLLVVDELHNFRFSTRRTKHLQYMSSKAKRVLALSGTLSDGEPELLCHLGKLIYRKRWPYTSSEFKKIFVVRKSTNSNYKEGEITPASQGDITPRYLNQLPLHVVPDYYALFRQFIHRSTLQDPNVSTVCTVPGYTERLISITLSAGQAQLYSSLVSDSLEELELLRNYGANNMRDNSAALRVLWPLLYCVNAPWHIADNVSCAKVTALIEILQRAKQTNRKVAIFTGINVVGHKLAQALKAALGEDAAVRLYASDVNERPKTMSQDARSEVIDKLLYDPKVRCGVLNISLCCESIDLTQVSDIVFWDIPWQPIKAFQAIRRVVRPGSITDHVNIYYLASPNAVDGHQFSLLQEKLRTLDKIMDIEYSDEVGENFGAISPVSVVQRLLF